MYILVHFLASSFPDENSILFGTTDFLSVQRCFVYAQNSPSTDVHGCTTVEDGSNGLTVSIFPRFVPTLPDAFTHSLEKICEILCKISHRRKTTAKHIFNAVALEG